MPNLQFDAAASQCSVEFVQWYALAKTCSEVHQAHEEWERANPGAADTGSPRDRLNKSLAKLEQEICERPVTSWDDAAEIGMIALFWSAKELHPGERPDAVDEFALGRDPDLECRYQGERPAAHLIQAVAKLAQAGRA